MLSVLAPKWTCFVLLTGLSTALATPLPDDDLFAFAPGSSNTFNSDLPVDGGPQDLSFAGGDGYDASGDNTQLFGDDSLLGFDPSTSGYDVALKPGDCWEGETLDAAGSVAAASCAASRPQVGCNTRPGRFVAFNSGATRLCATAHQVCCSSIIDAKQLGDCEIAPQPFDAVEFLRQPADPNDVIGGGLAAGAGLFTIENWNGLTSGLNLLLNGGHKKRGISKKRDAGFCPLDLS